MEPSPTPPPGRPPEPSPPGRHEERSISESARETVSHQPFIVKRLLAKLVDAAIALGVFLLVSLVLGGALGTLLGAVVAGAYFFVCDGLEVDFMRHRSLGKKLVGLSVQRLGGHTMNLEASARRNWMFALVWFVEPAGPLLTLLLLLLIVIIFIYEIYEIVTRSDGRRWGDQLAGTQVVGR